MDCWRLAWWSLFAVWIFCAILDMSHVNAGMLTSYGADLTLPAWLYIFARSLDNPHRQISLSRVFGRTPELAAGTFFVASTLTEISQYFWPNGIFPGTFDILDIVAYATGIGICYLLDKRTIEQKTHRSAG
jgi:hypothetical protein